MGKVIPLATLSNDDNLRREWRNKIAKLFKESGVEPSLLKELTENTTKRKCWLWKIDHMYYSAEELEKLYHRFTPVIAASVNRAVEKRDEQESKQQEKRKAKRGW